tara:strand:+ start:5781 stop:6185 length:405 start_codon:yes stop_codon:yes gene_type:complete
MSEERNWNLINCLCYLYNAFSVYTDGDLDDAEKKEITAAVNEWFKDSSMNEIHQALDLTLGWFNEDLKLDLADDESRVVIGTCVNIAGTMKENMKPESCKAVHNDLIRIGKADGKYDEVEQKWAEVLGGALGVV